MITNHEADILRHASNTGRFVTDDPFVIDLGKRGLLFDHGPQRLADGMHYLVMTERGGTALNEWSDAQPKPEVVKRRTSRAFRAWRDYLGATYDRMTFSHFWKEVWPTIKHQYWT